MPDPAHQLIGREEELAPIVRLLDDRDRLPGAAVLHGSAGIGKSSVWLAAIEVATARDYRILSSRPSDADTHLSYAGLGDLLDGVVNDILGALPPIQQRALGAALLLGEPDTADDERAVAAAFLGALRSLARQTPVCLAVDDLQWLDAPSLAALRFALSRLDDEPVAVLVTVRGEPPEWLRRTVREGALTSIEFGGLSIGATHELLHTRLGATFPRPTLIRLWETSGGNPFFALELAAALQRRDGSPAPGDPLPIPSNLDELLRERTDGLGPTALEVSQVVAALAEPTADLVVATLGSKADAGLAEALEARILELDGERLRFTHPLLGSAVVARETPAHRRSVHGRLATVAPTEEERARHLALSTEAPSGEIAAALEEAARSAQSRGAPATAAELAEQAHRLTPATDPEGSRRRVLLAADRYHAAGDTGRAASLLERARAVAAPGSERAAVLAQLAWVTDSPREAVSLYREALADAVGDDALRADIHLNLALLMRFRDGIEHGVEHGRLAVAAADRVGDAALRCRALAAHGHMHFESGRGIPNSEMDEAVELERSLPEWPLEDGPTLTFVHQLWWSGEVDRARTIAHELLAAASARDDAPLVADALWHLGMLEWRAGNWELADRHAAASWELCSQLGRMMPPNEYPLTLIAAHRGRVDDARARAEHALAVGKSEGMRVAMAAFSWVLGFVELSSGNEAAALPRLRRGYQRHGQAGRLEPGKHLWLGDLLEALVAAGELDEADEVIAMEEQRAFALDRAWALAILARGRGLLLAARGDLDGAFASFELALVEHARSTDPFHHARTLLALGKTQRRAKQRGAARATLEDALARFEALGAPLWAEQTRAELNRISGRAPSRGDLSEAERRIATLVAEGRTNRDVAAALFLTEHTVETSLSRIYRKLGVRSRAELAHLLASKT